MCLISLFSSLLSCTDNEARGTGFCLSTNQLIKLVEGLFLEPVPGRATRRDYVLKELEMGKLGLEKVGAHKTSTLLYNSLLLKLLENY